MIPKFLLEKQLEVSSSISASKLTVGRYFWLVGIHEILSLAGPVYWRRDLSLIVLEVCILYGPSFESGLYWQCCWHWNRWILLVIYIGKIQITKSGGTLKDVLLRVATKTSSYKFLTMIPITLTIVGVSRHGLLISLLHLLNSRLVTIHLMCKRLGEKWLTHPSALSLLKAINNVMSESKLSRCSSAKYVERRGVL